MAPNIAAADHQPLLNGDNYEIWSILMKTHLEASLLWKVINEESPKDGEADFEVWNFMNTHALLAIFKSCTPEVFSNIKNKKTAKDAWNSLSQYYGDNINFKLDIEKGIQKSSILHKIKSGDEWIKEKTNVQKNPTLLDETSASGMTVLHIATLYKHEKIVEDLTKMMDKDSLKMADDNGCSALALAAVRNASPEIARHMIKQDKELLKLETENADKLIPVVLAAREGHPHMTRYLYNETPDEVLNGRHGVLLLSACITRELYDVALHLLSKNKLDKLPLAHEENNVQFHPLRALVEKPSAFPSGTKLSSWQKLIHKCIWYDLDGCPIDVQLSPSKPVEHNDSSAGSNDYWKGDSFQFRSPFDTDRRIGNPLSGGLCGLPILTLGIITFGLFVLCYVAWLMVEIFFFEAFIKAFCWERIAKPVLVIVRDALVVVIDILLGKSALLKIYVALLRISLRVKGIEHIYHAKLTHYRVQEILGIMSRKVKDIDIEGSTDELFETKLLEAMIEAAKNGTIEFILSMTKANPDLFGVHDTNNRDMFSHAILHRRENIFQLINDLPAGIRGIITSRVDVLGNNKLHLAAKLAPKCELDRRPGAALQMQRELQWYKGVEHIVPPTFKENMNSDGKKPRELFSQEHEELVKEGEKWAKETATSFSLVGTLIITIMFAAAFTVPGGNNEETGVPVFAGKFMFTAFIIIDAISLFASATSVLIFIGILTSRYAEKDFLHSLPRKLLIGLLAIFLSVLTMMVAFCAAVTIILRKYVQIIVVAISLASVTAIIYVPSQFRLFLDIYKSTYTSESAPAKRNGIWGLEDRIRNW